MEGLINDRLFIQEIMNDMARKGMKWSKAWYLLMDWSRELKAKTHMRGRTKRMFFQIVGKENW